MKITKRLRFILLYLLLGCSLLHSLDLTSADISKTLQEQSLSPSSLLSQYRQISQGLVLELNLSVQDYQALELEYQRVNSSYLDLQMSFSLLSGSYENLVNPLMQIESNWESMESFLPSMELSLNGIKGDLETSVTELTDLKTTVNSLTPLIESLTSSTKTLMFQNKLLVGGVMVSCTLTIGALIYIIVTK